MLDVLNMKYSIAAEALLFTFQKNPTIKKFQDQGESCLGDAQHIKQTEKYTTYAFGKQYSIEAPTWLF